MDNLSIGEKFKDVLSHAYNVFSNQKSVASSPFQNSNWSGYHSYNALYGMFDRPDRVRINPSVEKSIIAAMYTKIAVDVSGVSIKHIKTDQNGRYVKDMDSGLNNCLTVEANLDQTSRDFIMDIVISMFDEGVVAVCPIETSFSLRESSSFDILTMRVGKISEWFPDKVKVNLYDERDGQRKDVVFPKSKVAIIENPFYSIMNQQNSTLNRLIRKLNLLDLLDERNNTTKFNMILQFPYTVRSETQKKKARERLEELESQLSDSPYGIAYTDGTEKIIQLNRAIESNLISEVDSLKKDLYSEIGITKEVFDGTADEQTLLNYHNSTLEPILSAIVDEMKRKFLTKTARTQGQTIRFVRDPFKLIPIGQIADIADKFTRNEILSSNELREIIGREPVDNPEADELRNKNLNKSSEQITDDQSEYYDEYEDYEDEEVAP